MILYCVPAASHIYMEVETASNGPTLPCINSVPHFTGPAMSVISEMRPGNSFQSAEAEEINIQLFFERPLMAGREKEDVVIGTLDITPLLHKFVEPEGERATR